MPLTLTVKSADDATKRHREAAAQRVLACLGDESPERRLLCFLDDEEWQEFKAANGVANRGFYAPVKASGPHWRIAPRYILQHVFFDGGPAFDDFVYLHGSTCSNDVGLTITLAHEMQHFVQHAGQLQLWAANTLIPNLNKTTIKALRLTWCDIPHERDARIVSKRTAENLFGASVIRQYIDAKIAERVTAEDAADWECIQDLDTSTRYDLSRETELFFPRLRDSRAELEFVLRHFQSNDSDFTGIDLDALLNGTSG
jgi:hypothetical protein